MTVRLQREDFDIGAEILALTAGRTDVGAVATFTGICRGSEGVAAMTLEHYPGMAEAEIERQKHRFGCCDIIAPRSRFRGGGISDGLP